MQLWLSLDAIDLSDPQRVEQLHGQVSALKGADVWVSLPCTFHCQWHKGGSEYKKRLKAKQRHVEDMLAKALPVLQTVLDNHGRVAVECPRHTLLRNLPLWQKFEQHSGLKRVYFDGCSFGVAGKHYPIRMPWCVSTSSLRLIQHLAQPQCDHSHVHEPAEGSSTEQTGYYPAEMVQVLCEALHPSQFFNTVPRSLSRVVSHTEPAEEGLASG